MSSPTSPVLQQLHRLDKSSSDFHDQLCNVLYGEEYVQCAPHLQDDDVVWLVDYLDTVLDGLDPPSPGFRKCLRVLKSVCGTRAILPKSYTVPSRLLSVDPEPFASGGYGDVYGGTLDGLKVCIKRVRVYTQDGPQKAARIFCQEAIMWKHLTHPNIVSLLGVTTAPSQLISKWMSGGDLPEYIEKNSNADRLRLLSDVANGLHYLHSCNVIHGDLKGPNILVDSSGRARIADFGLATVTQNLDSIQSVSGQRGHTARWAAPEVLKYGTYSKEADIFSFAMVMIEVFSGTIPFSDGSSFMAVLAITQGRRPPRPTHPFFTEDLWILMQRCWNAEPHLRPEASEALQVLLNPGIPTWKQLITHTLATHERISLIITIFSDHIQTKMVNRLDGDDAQAFIDAIDEELDKLPPEFRRKCLLYSSNICGHRALIPSSLVIPLCYDQTDPPLYCSGYADIWKGKYYGRDVAAKGLRVHRTNDLNRMKKGFCKEIVMWKSLHHTNVLPLLGVTVTGSRLVMVSEWMKNGNINEFVRAHPERNRLELLGDATEGLIYMHAQGVIHGDLRGVNILINNEGQACLADFAILGSSAALSDQTSASSASQNGFPGLRWMSPELLAPDLFNLKGSRPTEKSDCYALGMVIYEVLTGEAPFSYWDGLIVLLKILKGERPVRFQGLPDSIWEMLEHCWEPQPKNRPSLDAVLYCLRDVAQQWILPSISLRALDIDTGVDEDMETVKGIETDSDDQSHASASFSDLLIAGLPMTIDSIPPTMPGDYGLPDPSLDSPGGTITPTILQNSGQLLNLPQADNPEEGWIYDWIARVAWNIFRAATSQLHVL